MKKIVCEICECTEFVKSEGMFTCQGCGTKYSAEEVRGLMREVEGSASPMAVPAASAPAVDPSQQQMNNLFLLATNAYAASDYDEAEKYCNRIIEMDATHYKAWFVKAQAIGWSTRLNNNKMKESAHSFCQAIDFAPEEEKESIKNQAVDELKRIGLACISLRKSNFSNNPSEDNLNGFNNDRSVLIDSLYVLLRHGNAVDMPEGYLNQVASMMNEAAVAALNFSHDAWNKIEHPSDEDWRTYKNWNSNICNLLRESISVSDEDDEADILRYKNLNIVLMDLVGKASHARYWSSLNNRYEWCENLMLANSAVSARRSECQRNEIEISKIEASIAKKAKEARLKAFYEKYPNAKAGFEELKAKHAKLTAEYIELGKQLDAIISDTPIKNQVKNIDKQIKDLNTKRYSLGMFAGKEKKQLTEQIKALEKKQEELSSKVMEEQKAQEAKAAPLKAKRSELANEINRLKNDISELEENAGN